MFSFAFSIAWSILETGEQIIQLVINIKEYRHQVRFVEKQQIMLSYDQTKTTTI